MTHEAEQHCKLHIANILSGTLCNCLGMGEGIIHNAENFAHEKTCAVELICACQCVNKTCTCCIDGNKTVETGHAHLSGVNIVHALNGVGVDLTYTCRSKAVYVNACTLNFACKGHSSGCSASLTCCVDSAAQHGGQIVELCCGVYNSTVSALNHLGNKCLCCQHNAASGDSIGLVKIFDGRLKNCAVEGEVHSVVDENVNLAVLLKCLSCQVFNILSNGYVCLYEDSCIGTVICADFIYNSAAASFVSADYNDLCACPSQSESITLTYVTCSTCNNSYFTVEAALLQAGIVKTNMIYFLLKVIGFTELNFSSKLYHTPKLLQPIFPKKPHTACKWDAWHCPAYRGT